VLKQCLQVQSSKRPNCDQILKLPCIVKHITETLNNIEARKDMPEKLLNTIRCPLNLGQITNCMPASQYNSVSKSKIVDEQPSETKTSAMHKIKPLRDVSVRDNESVRLSSAGSNSNLSTPQSIKEQVSKKRYLSSNESKPSQVSVSTPDLSKVKRQLEEVVEECSKPEAAKFVSQNLGVIEEKADDGTGMDQIKVLLKAPQRKQMADPNLGEKPDLQKPEVPPRSEDILLRKRNILTDEQHKRQHKIMHREEALSKQVARLASMQQRVADLREQKSEKVINLPMIKPRHLVHQSVDNIKLSQPLLGRLVNKDDSSERSCPPEKVQINNLVNLRYKNRGAAREDDSTS
jgi:hypothetical protein